MYLKITNLFHRGNCDIYLHSLNNTNGITWLKTTYKIVYLRISSILWATKKSMTVWYGRNHRSIMRSTTCLGTRIIITYLVLIWCHLNITSWIQGQLRLITILLDIKLGLNSFIILSTTIKCTKLHHDPQRQWKANRSWLVTAESVLWIFHSINFSEEVNRGYRNLQWAAV